MNTKLTTLLAVLLLACTMQVRGAQPRVNGVTVAQAQNGTTTNLTETSTLTIGGTGSSGNSKYYDSLGNVTVEIDGIFGTLSLSDAGYASALVATNTVKIASVLTNASLSIGAGDDLNYVPAAGLALPYHLEIRAGSSSSPFTNTQPLIKVDRTEEMVALNFFAGSGTVSEQNAVFNIQAKNTKDSQAQVTPFYIVAQSMATNASGFQTNADACGIATTGRIIASGVGRGIGIYTVGRTDSPTGKTDGAEIRSWNESGADSLYNTAGASDMIGTYINSVSSGSWMSGAGVQIGGASSFHVGFGATMIGLNSPVKGYNFLENNTATNGIVLAGTHSQAFASGLSAGPVQIGRTNIGTVNADALLEVYTSTDRLPAVAWQGNGNVDVAAKVGNSSGSSYLMAVGTAGHGTTGTVAGDIALIHNTTNKSIHIGGSGNASVIQVKNSGSGGQFAAFGGTPVGQQDTDIETALVNYGWLVDSPLSGPQNNTKQYDEFFNAVPGEFEWSTGVSGTGAAWSTFTSIPGHQGIVQFQSGTATNSMSGIRTSGTAILFGGGRQTFSTSVRVPTLSDGTDAFTVFVGFHDVNGSVGEAVDGAYFVYSSSTTYYLTNTSAGSWVGKTSSNSARSETAPSAAVTANQFYILTVDVNAAGTQADYYIDGVLLGSLTTNIPISANRNTAIGYKIEKQAGTTSRNLDADYCWWKFKPTVAR